jgi:hypothetical protein
MYIIIFLIIVILLSFAYDNTNIAYSENFANNNYQIVVSRYNENLEWLKNEPFNLCKNIVIYNKGNNDNYYKPTDSINIKLPNVGKCDHSYIYHIIHNYDNIPEGGIVFLPGSADMSSKYLKAVKTTKLFQKYNKSVLICLKFSDVKKDLYNFEMINYETAYNANKTNDINSKTKLSNIRPFGKWYENKFGDIIIKHITFGGIFAVSKSDILNRPKTFYNELIMELNYPNPEVGHYIERSWEAIFYPMKNAKFINSNYMLDKVGKKTQ